jgi:SAM-dependent methyltransferase
MTNSTSNKPHWQDPANDQYWYQYWKARLTPKYYTSAEANDLTSDQLGSILLRVMSPQGLHLEAGCGAGYWVAALRHNGFNIEGIEYARDLVDLVHATNHELPVRQGDVLHIDSPDDHYDSYLSIGVVEHRVEGPQPFLSEAYRVLKPGGKILISVPFFGPTRKLKSHLSMYDHKLPELPFFQYGFTSEEFTSYLQKAGFSIEMVQPLYPHRLLLEEIALYRWIFNQSWSHFVKQCAEKLLQKKDGHMLLVVGGKRST